MSPRWAIAVVRIERFDEDVAGDAASRLLVRVQVGLDDEAPRVLSVQTADAGEARFLVGSAIDGIYEALTGSFPRESIEPVNRAGPSSSDQ